MSELPKKLRLFSGGSTIAIMNVRGKEAVAWMGFDGSYLPLAKRKTLARRLVACWNACTGIETEALEELSNRTIVDILITEGILDDE